MFHTIRMVEVTGHGHILQRPTNTLETSRDALGHRVVNLLPLIEPAWDSIRGVWTKRDDVLLSDRGEFSRIRVPYVPPEEYDLRTEYTPLNGSGEVVQILTHHDSRFTWHNAFDDTFGTGFEMIGDNGHKQYEPEIKNDPWKPGHRYTTVVQVRKNSIAAYLDGKLLSQRNVDYSDLVIWKDWYVGAYLGVGSHQRQTTFQKLELVEITGEGRVDPNNERRTIQPYTSQVALEQADDGTIKLGAEYADMVGDMNLESQPEPTINYWNDEHDFLQWKVQIKRTGNFHILLNHACSPNSAGGQYEFTVGGKSIDGKIDSTGSWYDYQAVKIGTIQIEKPGLVTFVLRSAPKTGRPYALNLRSITLTPVPSAGPAMPR